MPIVESLPFVLVLDLCVYVWLGEKKKNSQEGFGFHEFLNRYLRN